MASEKMDQLVRAMRRDEAWSTFWSYNDARKLVRAVLRELREPDEGMLEMMCGYTDFLPSPAMAPGPEGEKRNVDYDIGEGNWASQ